MCGFAEGSLTRGLLNLTKKTDASSASHSSAVDHRFYSVPLPTRRSTKTRCNWSTLGFSCLDADHLLQATFRMAKHVWLSVRCYHFGRGQPLRRFRLFLTDSSWRLCP